MFKFRFKKVCAVMLCGILASSVLLTGCNSNKKQVDLDPNNPVTIDIWHYYNGAQKTAFDQLIAEFNETVGAEKGIIVESYNKGNVSQLIESVIDSANNKVGTDPIPNIFAAYADTAYQVDKLELVADLAPYLSADEIKEYISSYIDEGRLGSTDQLKIFPTAKSTEIFMLNKTDWDKFAAATGASLDSLSTLEGLVETAEAYYNWTDSLTPNIVNDGKAFFGRDALANYMIIGSKQLGADIFDVKDGKVTFRTDEAVMRKLWDNYYVPYVKGYFAANGKFRSDDAKVGDIIALVGSTTSATYFPSKVVVNDEETYPIETYVMAAPCFKDSEPYAVQQGAGMVVTKSNDQEEYASVVFLRWFTEAQRNLDFSISSGYMPVKTESNTAEMLEKAFEAQTGENQFSDVLKDTLEVGFKTAIDQPLYTNQAFEGGTDARAVLENSLADKAAQDAQSVKDLIQGGMSRDEAIAKYDNDTNFNDWLTSFRKALEGTQEGK